MSVILKQFDGGAIAPRDDAILYNSIITRNGILNGCTITHLGANQIKITAGRGIIKGRMFEVEEMTVNCQLASAGTQKGRMYLRMELSNMENPAQIKTVAADTLPELVQEEDCNYTNGIYELELCTYDVTDTLLSNLKTTYEVIDTVFPVAKTLDDVNGVTDEDVLAGALAVKELSSDLGGCRFGYTEDGLPGYKKDGADTVYPFSSVRSISGVFSAYLPAGNMECHAIISRPENTSIKKITIQINRQIAGQTYIRVISNKGDTPTTIAQYSFAVQPPVLNQDIPFDISDNPDNIEIQAQTIPGGIMQQTNVPYTIEFSHTGT